MKKLYLLLFLLIATGLFAQETIDFQNLKKDEISGFKLYPNPATGNEVHITTSENNIKEIKIFDVFGELVCTERVHSKTINISKLIPGVYVVQVTENNKSITRKLIVR